MSIMSNQSTKRSQIEEIFSYKIQDLELQDQIQSNKNQLSKKESVLITQVDSKYHLQ